MHRLDEPSSHYSSRDRLADIAPLVYVKIVVFFSRLKILQMPFLSQAELVAGRPRASTAPDPGRVPASEAELAAHAPHDPAIAIHHSEIIPINSEEVHEKVSGRLDRSIELMRERVREIVLRQQIRYPQSMAALGSTCIESKESHQLNAHYLKIRLDDTTQHMQETCLAWATQHTGLHILFPVYVYFVFYMYQKVGSALLTLRSRKCPRKAMSTSGSPVHLPLEYAIKKKLSYTRPVFIDIEIEALATNMFRFYAGWRPRLASITAPLNLHRSPPKLTAADIIAVVGRLFVKLLIFN
ncbi:hypothetical protein EVAR_97959_1 [Eumeta japonica]|uniref:Uncharacterized protein n=1 Tax=Eumeta variegata TaxID=151549 RepID=A0A4C1XFJ9_EUMVA|nr:hypothetical protein EVAR_97959_1 [Eumeta japonica]